MHYMNKFSSYIFYYRNMRNHKRSTFASHKKKTQKKRQTVHLAAKLREIIQKFSFRIFLPKKKQFRFRTHFRTIYHFLVGDIIPFNLDSNFHKLLKNDDVIYSLGQNKYLKKTFLDFLKSFKYLI